jgi:hypothetical protein
MGRVKQNVATIVEAFLEDSPKKRVFGNYRIEGNALIYQAQSSEDCPRWDKSTFSEVRKQIKERIKNMDGKLAYGDGKPVLLESLTSESDCTGIKLYFTEVNTIAVKIPKSVTGLTDVVLVNSRTLDLIGRTVAYGNEDRNHGITEAQVILRGKGFPQVDLTLFLESDWATFKVIDSDINKTVKTSVQIGKYWRSQSIELSQSVSTGFLFEVDGKRYLSGCLKRELDSGKIVPFTYQVPAKTPDIDKALESLKPKEVVEAESKGLTVRQAGGFYFIPVADPVFRTFTTEEKLIILASRTGYDLTKNMLAHITGMDLAHKDKMADELLSYVPSARGLGSGVSARTAIIQDGKTLAIGKIETGGDDSLNIILHGWHQVVGGKHG